MPIEIRRLIFSNDKLVEALPAYRATSNEKIPEGKVGTCTVVNDRKTAGTLEIENQFSQEVYQVNLGHEFVGAVRLEFCFETDIPIPQNSCRSEAITSP